MSGFSRKEKRITLKIITPLLNIYSVYSPLKNSIYSVLKYMNKNNGYFIKYKIKLLLQSVSKQYAVC